jgi:EAL and modified HD-GYP domain-containing signal transduction protein
MPSHANEIVLGRQPILDRQKRLFAYELLYRREPGGEADVTDDAQATAQVVKRTFHELGVARVLGACRGFVNVDAEALMSRQIERLPTNRVVLELLETVVIDERLVHRCRDLTRRGFRFALDDFCRYEERFEPLLALVHIVKIDILQLDRQGLAGLVRRLRSYPARLLAEKVDTLERARHCLALGFDLFQGFFFGRPALLRTL